MSPILKGRTGLPPGGRKVTDWVGKWVRTVNQMHNGRHEIPAGFEAEVTYARSGLTLCGAPCKCCGVRVYITRVRATDVAVIDRTAS